MSQNNNNNLNQQNAPSQWAQIAGEIVDKLTGMNMSTTINFDNLEVDVPRAMGPDGRDLGSAKWVIKGKIIWATQASKKE
jgi:hypothetical protein